ncbi:hypothetical protein [Bacteriovorax sp. Seq25_V]|uniref:hypothetical protein n=1 Tax=Bacteriovorax sp. Seq25_V TaxID=1201288 RepID=UPI00038A0B50|nr:hypothetical protein [Bacteriovorax sp. Seq25_V]EQC46106.1 hypothetical protein M900_1675 [Bacteriovorax sp. Seq25_V]
MIFLLFSFFTFGDEFEYYKRNIEEVQLNQKYRRGEYLVYDCEYKHFACINRDSLVNCKLPSCLNIRKYSNQPECFQAQEAGMQKSRTDRYCKPIDN